MKKTLGLAAAAAVVLPMAVPAAAMADSSPIQTVPSLGAQQAFWNNGVAKIGCGAGEAVSAAWIGVPEQVLAIPGFLVGQNAPVPVGYTGPGDFTPVPPCGA